MILLVCLTMGKIGYYSVEWGVKKLAPPAEAALEIHRVPQVANETKRDKLAR